MGRIIESYIWEVGVRNLEREIGLVLRGKVVEYVDVKDVGYLEKYNFVLMVDDFE